MLSRLPAEPPVDPARSRLMGRVAQTGSRPEMVVRRALHAAGFRYRLHVKDLPGRPDLVFPARRSVVFVHGCFWHRHPGCHATTMPKTRANFWRDKFAANQARDARVCESLAERGWAIHVVWECETRDRAFLEPLLAFLSSRAPASTRERIDAG